MTAAFAFLLVSVILERLFDPWIAVPAVLAGLACRSWLHVAAVAAAIAALVTAATYVNNFHPALLAMAWAAAAMWGSLGYTIRKWLLTGKAPSR